MNDQLNLDNAQLSQLLEQAGKGYVSSQDIVDVVSGQDTPMQRLLVGLAAQRDASIQARLDALTSDLEEAYEEDPASRPWVWRLFEAIQPSLASTGVRSSAEDVAFTVTELSAQIILNKNGPRDDQWILDGLVIQNYIPAAGRPVALDNGVYIVDKTVTDDEGHFAFSDLPSGIYQLYVYFNEGSLRVSDIELAF